MEERQREIYIQRRRIPPADAAQRPSGERAVQQPPRHGEARVPQRALPASGGRAVHRSQAGARPRPEAAHVVRREQGG